MSNNADSASVEDGDECLLFNDGFSIVDDLNAPLETVAAEETPKENQVKSVTNVKRNSHCVADSEDKNSQKKTASDGEAKKGDTTAKGKEAETKSGNPRNNPKTTEEEATSEADKTPSKATTDSPPELSNNVSDKSTNKDDQEKAQKQSPDVNKAALRKKNEACFVWVSNITKSIKASSLKKHFAECGKVSTAKVVTNGKVFFGYVEFEIAEHASACIKKMNNTVIEGRNILVTRTRPDVTKKPVVVAKKTETKEQIPSPKPEEDKPQKKSGSEKSEKVETPKTAEVSEKNEEKTKVTSKDSAKEKKKNDKTSAETKKKSLENQAKKTDAKKDTPKERSTKTQAPTKIENELRRKLNDNVKKMNRLRVDLDRSRIEITNLRRRLSNEQRRSKDEESRSEKYKSEARSLSDQLKQVRADNEKEVQRLIKKHKLELEKATYQRESYIRKEEELKRRQDDLDKEYKRIEETKRSLERMKRTRKSRSPSPPVKRYRGREDAYPERKLTPPPPKLSSEVRSKIPSERIPTYYDEKKLKGVYNRLGDYGDKDMYVKGANGRHRSGYAGDVDIPKSHWPPPAISPEWKKPISSSSLSKPYMERFGSASTEYPIPNPFFPSASSYFKHGPFENPRKH